MNILLIFAITLSLLTSFAWCIYTNLYLQTATSATGERSDGKHLEVRDALILAIVHIAFAICSSIWFPKTWVYALALIAVIILQLVNKQGHLRFWANSFIGFTYVALLFIAVAVAADNGKKTGIGTIILFVVLSILTFAAGFIKDKIYDRLPRRARRKLDSGEFIAVIVLGIIGLALIAGIIFVAVNYL